MSTLRIVSKRGSEPGEASIVAVPAQNLTVMAGRLPGNRRAKTSTKAPRRALKKQPGRVDFTGTAPKPGF